MTDNLNSRNKNTGPGSQINGNQNILINMSNTDAALPLSKTEIYNLLSIVLETSLKPDSEYSLIAPAELNTKLIYNNAPIYKDIFSTDFISVQKLDSVMNDFNNSEDIVLKLRKLFMKFSTRDTQGNMIIGNGDDQLDCIKVDLSNLIKMDVRFLEHSFTEEKLEKFLDSLLAYGVSKCKVLLNPNESS